MVVLDAVHQVQAESANDLAVRWSGSPEEVRGAHSVLKRLREANSLRFSLATGQRQL